MMSHRHINDTTYTLPAIDSIIEHGDRPDWAALQIAMRSDPELCRKVFNIACHNLDHPYTIRYHYWYHFAKERLENGKK
ncbi:hypothetical protein FACS1894187_19310 [Synergistales bacterium]|nr:hypothetical protein FACS1894187_19310 [Synergistales bacterium]